MTVGRRDIWLDGEHFALTRDEYDTINSAAGSPELMDPDELETVLSYLRAQPQDDRSNGDSPDSDHDHDRERDVEADVDELEEGPTPRSIDPVTPEKAREYADYWVLVYGTGTQKKGLHVPGDDSTRDKPTVKCDRRTVEEKEGEWKAKDLEVFPEGYCPERICSVCRREIAYELDLDETRDDRVEGDQGVE